MSKNKMKIYERVYKKIYNPKRLFLLDGMHIGDILFSYLIVRKGIYDFIFQRRELINGRVLDFGCGEKPYEPLFSYDEYIGVDVKISGHSSDRHGKVDYYYENFKLPFEDSSFDNVISTQVFEHVYEIDQILDEIYRVMRKDGIILVTVPLCSPEHEIPFDYFRYTTYGIKKKLENHGFEVVECRMLNTKKNAVRQIKILNAISEYLTREGGIKGCTQFFYFANK